MSPAVCVCADLWTVCESLYRRNALDVQVSFLVLPNVCVCVCMLQKPRYSDGDLTLIYSGGEECSSGFQRMSVISFECNHTAGERGSASVGRVCGSRGVVGRSALLQTQSRRAPSVVAGRRTPPPTTSGGHTPPVSIFCLCWEWAWHWACWESLPVPRSALTGVWTEPAGWAAQQVCFQESSF